MKSSSRAKIGNRKNSPAYRTPAVFRYRAGLKTAQAKSVNLKNKSYNK
jgi:hypothetical protein